MSIQILYHYILIKNKIEIDAEKEDQDTVFVVAADDDE